MMTPESAFINVTLIIVKWDRRKLQEKSKPFRSIVTGPTMVVKLVLRPTENGSVTVGTSKTIQSPSDAVGRVFGRLPPPKPEEAVTCRIAPQANEA